MTKWPREVKAHMNMYDWAKEDDELVEVIYACMDGYVYFLDLETGNLPGNLCIWAIHLREQARWIPEGTPSCMWERAITATTGLQKYLLSTFWTAALCILLETMMPFL